MPKTLSVAEVAYLNAYAAYVSAHDKAADAESDFRSACAAYAEHAEAADEPAYLDSYDKAYAAAKTAHAAVEPAKLVAYTAYAAYVKSRMGCK